MEAACEYITNLSEPRLNRKCFCEFCLDNSSTAEGSWIRLLGIYVICEDVEHEVPRQFFFLNVPFQYCIHIYHPHRSEQNINDKILNDSKWLVTVTCGLCVYPHGQWQLVYYDALLLRKRCSSLCAGWDGYWTLKAVQASQRLVSQSESFGEKINPPYFLHGKQRDF